MFDMKGVIKSLKEKQLLSLDSAKKLECTFYGLTLGLIKNQLNYQNRIHVGRRHNDDAKRFALTLHFYSPRAYEYLRSIFTLSHPSSLANWTSSVNCEVGFFTDIFKKLQNLANILIIVIILFFVMQ